MSLENAIVHFCRNNCSFTLQEIENFLKGDFNLRNGIVADYLEESGIIFKKEDKNKVEYLTRNVFFREFKFRVIPTDYEIENGILIPGHRFLPFCGPELIPSEIVLIDVHSGTQLKSKKISEKVEDLYKYHYLLGADSIIDNFVAEDPSNKNIIGKNPRGEVNIWVFDFENIYKRQEFLENKTLIAQVDDWETGTYKLSIAEPNDRDYEETILFMETLEQSLFKVFEKDGPYLDISEQLARAYFLSNDPILKKPLLAIDEFIAMSEKIKIKYFEQNTLLWHKCDDELTWKPSRYSHDEIFSISNGNISSLDEILKDLGLAITSADIKILFKKSHGKKNIEEILLKLIPFSSIKFKDKAQEVSFKNFLEELYEESQK